MVKGLYVFAIKSKMDVSRPADRRRFIRFPVVAEADTGTGTGVRLGQSDAVRSHGEVKDQLTPESPRR